MIMLSVVYSQYKQFSSIPDVLFVFKEGFIFYFVIAVLHGIILNSPVIRLVNNNKYLPNIYYSANKTHAFLLSIQLLIYE